MARKVQKLKITAAGRDQGKVFVLTELPARAAHSWATRALLAVMNAGVELTDNLEAAGMAGIAAVGLKALGRVPAELAEPLLDELLGCVETMPNPDKPEVTRRLIDDDIEEVGTIFTLQREVLKLHIDFFTSAAPPTSA